VRERHRLRVLAEAVAGQDRVGVPTARSISVRRKRLTARISASSFSRCSVLIATELRSPELRAR
jgi:hypothetical protein